MRVAIVHYHLRPGGVTRVIRAALTALAATPWRCAVLGGSTAPEFIRPDEPFRAVPGLGYDGGQGRPDRLLDHLREAAIGLLGGPPDLWHIHNHHLGKNAAWTAAVSRLVASGERVLLHIHDFPEDGRPALYAGLARQLASPDGLYPCAPRTHYAVLTSRDRNILAGAGLDNDHLHLLPNAATLSVPTRNPPAAEPLVLYPTRAIRRKNLGEFLLAASQAPRGWRFATTLAPTDPTDVAPYDAWKRLATALRLPVEFEIGQQGERSYAALLASASALATTSVAEGFGLAFIEPWLAGRPLLGRNLPDITEDLRQNGLDLSGLYTRWPVTLTREETERLRSAVERHVQRVFAAYGRAAPRDGAERMQAALSDADGVDFGALDEALQREVLQRIVSSGAAQPGAWALPPTDAPDRLAANRRAVESHYAPAAYARRLLDLYEQVLGNERPAQPIAAGRVLDAFLDPARFTLLRS